MPATLTYPGVYIEEIPSGVRTITGVATSITAFVGRARRGTLNEPTLINSFGDFERRFGGLQEEYLMSYSVRDFYQNGGQQALIVRVAHPNFATDGDRDKALEGAKTAKTVADATEGADVAAAKKAANDANTAIQGDNAKTAEEKAAAKAVSDAVDAAAAKPGATVADLQKAAQGALPPPIPTKAVLQLPTETSNDPLILEAADEGEWGNALLAHADRDGIDGVVKDRYKPFGLAEEDLFNLTIRNRATGVVEQFRNVAVKPDKPRSVDNVLKNESSLVRVKSMPSSGTLPQKTDDLVKADLQKIVDKGKAQNATDAEKQAGKDAENAIAKLSAPFKPTDESRYTKVLTEGEAADGGNLDPTDITAGAGLEDNKRGLFALNKADLFNLLCIPPDTRGGDTDPDIYAKALDYCTVHRAMLIVDPPAAWGANKDTAAANAKAGLSALGLTGESARNGALYFPRVTQADPKHEGQPDTFPPCGIIAGVMARTDTNRGVWKAPAGLDAAINGVRELQVNLNDAENGMLNPLGINCLRFFAASGRVVWGSRTLRGADQLADEYKYVPVRRLALYIEESLYRGTQWVVFEPNDEPLWAQIRLNVGAFMHGLFRQGAFQGQTPRDAYFVKCDKETTTQTDINLGVVNILVGFAPLKPAEFVVIKIQQMAGQIET
jgi:Bacteriophage tail sheath protein